jgi:trans-aconitate methyltransferase
LEKLKSSNSVLVLGGGTGWWLNQLLAISPQIRITYIDASVKMLDIAKANVNSDSIQFIHGTQKDIPTDEKYDAVMLFYFLDLFRTEELPVVTGLIDEHLNSRAQWLVADFVDEKKWHSLFLTVMYRFFNFATGLATRSLPDWRQALRQKNLRVVDQASFYGKFIRATRWTGSTPKGLISED